MRKPRRILFAALTLVLFLALVEGVAQIVWHVLENDALAARQDRAEQFLRNDTIHFMKEPDGVYGYTLRPGEYPGDQGETVVNRDGFAQRNVVPVARQPGIMRVVAMGESTTQGHNTSGGNYPSHLRRLLRKSSHGPAVEVINAGVAGWISDQVALFAENKVATYRPDIVVLYVGWNDFQSYSPYLTAPPAQSWFQQEYGEGINPATLYRFKSLYLLSAVFGALARDSLETAAAASPAPDGRVPPIQLYKYFRTNLDRIVAAYRSANPDVKIAISTLVGRWPHGDMSGINGQTWWMERNATTPQQAADYLQRFNELIRVYAREHGLILIDTARAFAPLRRQPMMRDFAHMVDEGYEMIAETMYETLRQSGAIGGEPSPRRAELLRTHAK